MIIPERLRELQWLVDDALALLVVADFGVSLRIAVSIRAHRNGASNTYGQREILAERMTLEAVVCQDTSTAHRY